MVSSLKFWSSGYELYHVQRFVCVNLARVVQTLDNAIHRINHYPADKYYGNHCCVLIQWKALSTF